MSQVWCYVFAFFTLLYSPYHCIGMKRVLDEGPQVTVTGSIFHVLPVAFLTNLVARTNSRNALRKTCKLFKVIASTTARPNLVLHPDFKGSAEDIIKACEHYIEVDDHNSLQTIITRYGLGMLSHTNVIGYSLEEYALLLNRHKCLEMLSTSATRKALPSLVDRCYDFTMSFDNHKDGVIKRNAKAIVVERLFAKLLDALYLHRATKNDAEIDYLFSQKAIAEYDLCGHQYAQSPGHIAAYNGDNDLIEKLSVLKPTHHEVEMTEENYNPLGIACMRGYPLCVKTLLQQGSYTEQERDIADSFLDIKTPLCQAAQRGFTECARLLLDSKQLWSEKEQCQLALLYATQSGCAEIVELLLAKGTDPNIPIETIEYFYNDETIIAQKVPCTAQPIDLATHYGDHTILTKLIAAGALATKYETQTSCFRTFMNPTVPSTPPYVSDGEE